MRPTPDAERPSVRMKGEYADGIATADPAHGRDCGTIKVPYPVLTPPIRALTEKHPPEITHA
jgi:hypothetical protein